MALEQYQPHAVADSLFYVFKASRRLCDSPTVIKGPVQNSNPTPAKHSRESDALLLHPCHFLIYVHIISDHGLYYLFLNG